MPAARTDISLKRLGTVFVASGAMFMTAGNTDVPSMTAGDFGVAAMTEQDAGVAAMTGRGPQLEVLKSVVGQILWPPTHEKKNHLR